MIQALVPRKLQLSGASIGGDCVLYTSEKLRAPNIYSLQPGIRVSVCISPPCHASRISSRLHFKPVAKCRPLLSPFSLGRAFSWSPSHHPYPPVWSFSIELASFRQRENPQVLSRSGWSGGEAAVLSENQSPFAELECTYFVLKQVFLFMPNFNWSSFATPGREKLF